MVEWSDEELDKAIAYWQPRSPEKLSREDAREINNNLLAFGRCLLDMDRELRARGIDVLKMPPPKWRLEHGELKGPDRLLVRRYAATNGYTVEFTAVAAKKVAGLKTRWRVRVSRGSEVEGGDDWIVRTPEIEGVVEEVASRPESSPSRHSASSKQAHAEGSNTML